MEYTVIPLITKKRLLFEAAILALKNLCQKPLVVEYPVCFGLLTSMVFFLLQDFWLVLSNPNNLDVKFIRNNPKACTTIIFGKG